MAAGGSVGRGGLDLGIEGIRDAVEVGRGAYGTVYRADQPRNARRVAVKVFAGAMHDEMRRRRVAREWAAHGRLSDHPNVVDLHEGGFARGGHPYMVMAYHPSGSYGDHVRRHGPLPWSDALAVGVEVAGALAYAHQVGVLHRDIKPENVLRSRFGCAQLTDFGLSGVIDHGMRDEGAGVFGTVSHLAPELVRGGPHSVATDLYALGSTLFTLVGQSAPFEDDRDRSIQPMMARIVGSPPPRLEGHGVPEAFAAVVDQLLAKEPGDRPASAADLGRALQDIQRAAGGEVSRLALPNPPGSGGPSRG